MSHLYFTLKCSNDHKSFFFYAFWFSRIIIAGMSCVYEYQYSDQIASAVIEWYPVGPIMNREGGNLLRINKKKALIFILFISILF